MTDGGGTTIATGSGVSVKPAIDSMSIDPSASPATTPKIYTGVWNSSTKATVKNWATNWTGQSVCAGGATTGTHCGTGSGLGINLAGDIPSPANAQAIAGLTELPKEAITYTRSTRVCP